jgi:hypothetical protein
VACMPLLAALCSCWQLMAKSAASAVFCVAWGRCALIGRRVTTVSQQGGRRKLLVCQIRSVRQQQGHRIVPPLQAGFVARHFALSGHRQWHRPGRQAVPRKLLAVSPSRLCDISTCTASPGCCRCVCEFAAANAGHGPRSFHAAPDFPPALPAYWLTFDKSRRTMCANLSEVPTVVARRPSLQSWRCSCAPGSESGDLENREADMLTWQSGRSASDRRIACPTPASTHPAIFG